MQKSLLVFLFFGVAVCTPRLLWGTALPTEGGRVVLSGFELTRTIVGSTVFPTDVDSLEIVVGGIPCLKPRVHSDNLASCTLPANTGGCGLPIIVVNDDLPPNNVSSSEDYLAHGYDYQRPVITNCPPMPVLVPGPQQVVLHGRNFGLTNNNDTVEINFVKRPGAEPIPCDAIVVSVAHSELSCEIDFLAHNMTGEYFVEVNVNGCINDWINEPTLTLEHCYKLQSLNADGINQVLLKKALSKNMQRLEALRYRLGQIKTRLPPFDENNCCGSDYEYLVSLLHLTQLDQLTMQFRDCLNEFCEERDEFQEKLLGMYL